MMDINSTTEDSNLSDGVNTNLRYGEDYDSWKGWSEEAFGQIDNVTRANFVAELRRVYSNLPISLNVLEIGFGNGSFLRYARDMNWTVVGVEINEVLIKRARMNGYDVRGINDLRFLPDENYDLIVAFDVLEHIPQDITLSFLEEIRRLMKLGGYFIARFPNGDSPFSLPLQNGDVTHVSMIGSGKIKYYSQKLDLKIIYMGRSAQPIRGIGFVHSLHRMLTIPVKIFLNLIVKILFFARDRIEFFSSNMTIVMQRIRH